MGIDLLYKGSFTINDARCTYTLVRYLNYAIRNTSHLGCGQQTPSGSSILVQAAYLITLFCPVRCPTLRNVSHTKKTALPINPPCHNGCRCQLPTEQMPATTLSSLPTLGSCRCVVSGDKLHRLMYGIYYDQRRSKAYKGATLPGVQAVFSIHVSIHLGVLPSQLDMKAVYVIE